MEMGNYKYGIYNRLPNSRKDNDYVMVVVDKLRKAANLILVKSTYNYINIEYIFMK